jgi:hypothetical protein
MAILLPKVSKLNGPGIFSFCIFTILQMKEGSHSSMQYQAGGKIEWRQGRVG